MKLNPSILIIMSSILLMSSLAINGMQKAASFIKYNSGNINHNPAINYALNKSLTKKKQFLTELSKKPELSSTELHIVQNKESLVTDNTFDSFMKDEILYQMMQKIIAKEKALQDAGYYTFIHGQHRKHYIPLKIYTKLWASKKGLYDIQDYIFPRFFEDKERSINIEDDNGIDHVVLTGENKIRNYLLKKAPFLKDAKRVVIKNNLFMNWSLFANKDNIPCCTADYIARQGRDDDFTWLYNYSGLSTLLKRTLHIPEELYRCDLGLLQRSFNMLSDYGTALMIAVPKKMINDAVYCGNGYGQHKDFSSNQNGPLLDMHAVMNKVKNGKIVDAKDDIIEFCMPITFDLALNPFSGIKIFQIPSGDEKHLQEIENEENALVEKMKKGIRTRQQASWRLL